MRTGLVLGKFMPLHKGHLGLIAFGLAHCDTLIVLVCARDEEPIPGPLRLQWMRQTYQNEARVRAEYTDEALPDAEHSCRRVSLHWARYLHERFPQVDVIFSSEPYGDYVAEAMQIQHQPYNMERSLIPISASLIRSTPFRHWDYLAPAARPYFVKRVCVFGPESTGKSTLTVQLAEHFNTTFVPETARALLGERHVVYEDIAAIIKAQASAVLEQSAEARCLLFCDTDLLTTRIYSEHYFGRMPPVPDWVEAVHVYDLYLFCDIDTPWIADPQRDLGDRRTEFRDKFLEALVATNIPYTIICGSWEERLECAVQAVHEKFNALS